MEISSTNHTALDNLTTLAAVLDAELKHLPDAQPYADHSTDQTPATQEAHLYSQINGFWAEASERTLSRRELFVTGLELTLRDELALKIKEGELHRDYARCLPGADEQTQVVFNSLQLQFNENEWIEIAGAMVITAEQGQTLLSLPGHGAEGYTSTQKLCEALTDCINHPLLRHTLLRTLEQRYQSAILDIETEGDLYLEPFVITDWRLSRVKGSPFDYTFDRLLNKQRADINDLFKEYPADGDKQSWIVRLDRLIKMPKNWGPDAVIAAFENQRSQRQRQRELPDWFKLAGADERQRCIEGLLAYDQARDALMTVLGSAASPEHYAQAHLRTRIANDLGYDLDPEHLVVTTQRRLPLTAEQYEIIRPLTQLALFGLHPGDRAPDSAFLTQTRIALDGQPLDSSHERLTPTYLVGIIEDLDLRASFGAAQREAYGSPQTLQLMRGVMHQRLIAQAYAAQLQGHIRPDDLALIQSLDPSPNAAKNSTVLVQQLKLNNRDTLSRVLVLRKLDAAGSAEHLLMFTPDIPRAQCFQRFDNERQLLNELVSWSTSPELSEFLIGQIAPSSRDALKNQLQGLAEKPTPSKDFISYTTWPYYGDAMRTMVSNHIRIKLAEQSLHTPDWYLRTGVEQRQKLMALEDAIVAARELYDAKPHTRVSNFETFVHQAASRKINQLLGLAEGIVDPDQLVITSPRETLTYTQMLRNGYDDSLGMLNASAATMATFKGPDGIDLSPLTAEKVAGSVRGQWLSDEYIAIVQKQLLAPDSEGYAYRRRHSLLLTQLQMSAAALRSLLKGQIDAQQYQWLSTSIEHMHISDSATRSRYPVYPLQFKDDLLAVAIQIETVSGCHLLTPEGPNAADQALLYTPQAPDGYEFRPLKTFANTLLRNGMSDYYKDRCRLKAGRSLALFLAGMKKGESLKPDLLAKPHADLHDVCFSQPLRYKIREVEQSAIGRNDMLGKLVWNSLELIAAALTLPFPYVSFAVGAAMFMHDSYRILDALSEGDHESSGIYVLSAWLNALGAAGDLHSGLKGLGGMLKDVARNNGPGSLPRRGESLVTLHDEVFSIGAPHAKGQAPAFQPPTVSPDSMRSASTNRPIANPSYAVNISLADGLPAVSDHAHGVTMLHGKHYVTLNDQVFQVQYDARVRVWNIVDPGNPFAFFGKRPIRLNEQGQWQLLEAAGLQGGMPPMFKPLHETPAGPSTAVGDLSDYEMPESLQPYLFGIVSARQAENFQESAMALSEFFADIFTKGRETYITLRQNLYRDAAAFFENAPVVAKPDLPSLDGDATVDTLIKATLEKTNGLVISEAPTSVASKQFLIENMPLLAEQKVEILYLEHLLTDQHLHKLQKYKARGSKSRSGSHQIKHHLETVNDGALKNRSDKLDYYHVIKTAHRHGIEVKSFSCATSYDFAETEIAAALGDRLAQQKMSAFFGNRIISADVQAQPARRWVALLDHRIANTWQQQPGISELQGAISLRVEDIANGSPLSIVKESPAHSHADFRLEMGSPQVTGAAGGIHAIAPPSKTSTALEDALYRFFERRSLVDWGLDPSQKAFVSQRKAMVNPYEGEHGFKWNSEGHWERADALTWTRNVESSAIQLSLQDIAYELPAELRPTFHHLANFEHRGLNPDYFFSDPDHVKLRERFFGLSKQLQIDARAVLSVELPARPTLTPLTEDITSQAFLETLYENTVGVVVGEAHAAIASKRLIIDNLEHLARQDVKTLYMEHLLTDIHQADLDRFAETGLMSKILLHDLKKMDRQFRTDPQGVYTFENLVIQARTHGIEVRAIDCAASYHIRNLPTATADSRQQMFSYFGSRAIRKHQEVMGEHKWIALVGNSHANTFKGSVPGIAELQQGVGVHAVDVAPGKSRGTLLDPGEYVNEDSVSSPIFLKHDYRIEMELPVRPQLTIPFSERLYRSGMFLIDESEPGHPVIVHRSKDKSLKSTPVRLNPDGKWYIEQERWTQIHRKPFDDLRSLKDALVAMKLKHVA